MVYVAYFSKEIGIKSSIPTYAGGLGILAGDTLKAAADLGLDFLGVTLNNTSFKQYLDKDGWQTERYLYETWNPSFEMKKIPVSVDVEINGGRVKTGSWVYHLVGSSGKIVPIYFLDTNVEGNNLEDRKISSVLYPTDPYQKIVQNMVLSTGGLYMLRKLGYNLDETIIHMNESPPALVTLKLLEEYIEKYGKEKFEYCKEKTREQCVFTSHTPLLHGDETFEYSLVKQVMNHWFPSDFNIEELTEYDGKFSSMKLASSLSGFKYAVSRKTAELLNKRFGQSVFDGDIPNGVHSFTWTSPEFQELYDESLSEWRNDPGELRNAYLLDKRKVWDAHQRAKKRMINYTYQNTGIQLNPEILTIGFARRATAYKRPELIFSDVERLKKMGNGKLQLVFSGKAHQNEWGAKELIYKVVQIGKELTNMGIPTVFLDNYDMNIGALVTAGVDLLLNTPRKPFEASGTSGMKAAHNGVPSLSVLDGWWIDGCKEGITGWSIGDLTTNNDNEEADSLYKKLEEKIIPLYYSNPNDGWIDVMIGAISQNASYYNTHRLVKKCCEKAYRNRVREPVKV